LALAQYTTAEEPGEPLSTFKDCDQCPEMVVIPEGSFIMGSPENEPQRGGREGPQHQVRIAKPFAIGKYEVSFDEWDACVAEDGCDNYVPRDSGWGRGRQPVTSVGWTHAKAYVSWLSKKTGARYRLPSEAEWEYAARAGTTSPFSTGQTITTDQANFNGSHTYNGSTEGVFRQRTTPVGSFAPNAFGLHDMHGNLREYVEDCWHESYEGAPNDGSAWASDGCDRPLLRDGSWKGRPVFIRSAIRDWVYVNGAWKNTFGFRVARDHGP
jgi:formylglycine-generating enzyme required for sulfatase activity